MTFFLVGAAVVILNALLGLGLKLFFYASKSERPIPWREFVLVILASAFFVTPGVSVAGNALAVSNLLTYSEYLNGWETNTQWQRTTCTEDGMCHWTYACDYYWVTIHYQECDTDGKNCQDETRQELRNRDCPYTKQEWTFIVRTTLGDYTIAESRLPDNPDANRWDSGVPVSADVISQAGIGIPDFWAGARDRLAAGNPGPVTQQHQYDNYILASDAPTYRAYSSSLRSLKAAGLLPPLAIGGYSFYLADKVHFIGYSPENPGAWQNSLMKLNAALGSELQGDVQLVIVQDSRVEESDVYIEALKAYWQSAEFQKNALAKNSIIVAIGTDGSTITWARATTGMPSGNEPMIEAIKNQLPGTAVGPESVIGVTQGVLGTDGNQRIPAVHGSGALEKILWGIGDSAIRFKRVSMGGGQPEDNGTGFKFLINSVHLRTDQFIWIGVIAFLLSALLWWIALAVGSNSESRSY